MHATVRRLVCVREMLYHVYSLMKFGDVKNILCSLLKHFTFFAFVFGSVRYRCNWLCQDIQNLDLNQTINNINSQYGYFLAYSDIFGTMKHVFKLGNLMVASEKSLNQSKP